MRVVLATTAPDTGGVAKHMLDLADGLRRRGHELVIASRADAGRLIAVVRTHRLRWMSLAGSALADTDVWHLHVHNSLDTRVLPLLMARRARLGAAIVMTEHQPRSPRTDFTFPVNLRPSEPRGVRKPGAARLKPPLKRAQFRVCDAVVTVSHASADFLVRRWGADPSELTTIHNGIAALPAPPPPRASSGQMRVVAVGELHWLKGFDVLIEAAARAQQPWTVRIVGDGALRASLEAQASRLHGGRVEFVGRLEDGPHAGLDADVVCVPSRNETLPYVALEGMACARPVVATTVDGVGELVRDGKTGLLVPPDDPVRLADALDSLAEDPQRRQQMGRRGYELVADEFRLDQMVTQTAALYAKVRSKRGVNDPSVR